MSKRSYLNKNDKLLLFYLIRDKVMDYLDERDESEESGVIKCCLNIVRYIKLAETLHLDINKLIDPVEYIHMKRYLFMKGYNVDD